MGRLDTVKKEFPNLNWETLKAFDPSKSQKYLRWLGANHSFYSPEELKNLILNFERRKDNLSKKDINKYSADLLAKELESLGLSRKEEKILGAIELTEGVPQGTKIYLIEGEKASQQYFANTRWCVSNFDTFLSYARDRNLFVVIKDNVKLCVLIDLRNVKNGSYNYSSIFDPQDRSIQKETLEVLSSFGKSESELLSIVKICEAFSEKTKNFWFDYNHNKLDLDKALSFTSADRVIRLLRGNKNIFIDEVSLDKLLTLTSSEKIFEAMIGNNYSAEKDLHAILHFIFNNKEKYKDLAKLFASSQKKIYGGRRCFTISALWKDLESSSDTEVLMKQIKKAGGISKLLQNKEIAKIISSEISKQIHN